jgi:alanine dehydrogenase
VVLVITNDDTRQVLDMPGCIDALYGSLAGYARGDAARVPRVDTLSPTSEPGKFTRFTTAAGVIRDSYYALRLKPEVIHWPVVDGVRRLTAYYGSQGYYGGVIFLCSTETSELVAIIQDWHLQRLRTGAAAGLSARYLARKDSQTLGMLGSGGFARTFAAGLAAELPLRKIKVFSPTPEHKHAYCAEMSERLNISVEPMDDPDSALADADVVAACTNSMEPVLHGHQLRPGVLICNVSNRELSKNARARITTVGHLAAQQQSLVLDGYRDANFDIRMNTMAYLTGSPEEREQIPRTTSGTGTSGYRHAECVDWTTGEPRGRQSDDEIILAGDLAGGPGHGLSSAGISGVEFTSLAVRAYESAQAANLGTKLPDDLFAQHD